MGSRLHLAEMVVLWLMTLVVKQKTQPYPHEALLEGLGQAKHEAIQKDLRHHLRVNEGLLHDLPR